MASLEAAVAERSAQFAKNCKSPAKRITADPSIGVESLARVIRDYLSHHKTSDLWSLVCPPPGGPLSWTWATPVCGPWLVKVAGLVYDFLGIAPNSKLLAVRVKGALESLHKAGDLTVAVHKGKTLSDHFDKVDMAIRLLMHHARQLKTDEKLKNRVFRQLVRPDQVKIELCLDRLDLRLNFEAEPAGDEPASATCLDLVPWTPPVEEAPKVATPVAPAPASPPPLPPPVAAPLSRSKSFCRDSLFRVPSVFQKILGRSVKAPEPSVGHKKKHRKPKKVKQAKKLHLKKATTKPLILPNPPKGTKNPPKGKMNPPNPPKGKKVTEVSATIPDSQLLADALAYAPQAAEKKNPKPKKQPKKAAKKPSISQSSPSEKKTVVPKSSENPKKPVTSNSIPIVKFEAPSWGQCKLEQYSEKSYIRYKDSDLKWKSVVSCCSRGLHHQVMTEMVDHVKKGLSSKELFEIRDEIVERLQAS